MKARPLLATLGAFAAVTLPAAHAYSVHFSFSEPDNWLRFVANPGAGTPWDGSAGVMTHLDIYYDPATTSRLGSGEYHFHDPSKDFWQVRIATDELGTFLIRRPLDLFRTSEHGIEFSRLEYVPGDGVEFFDFGAVFAEQIASDKNLPGALIPTLPSPLTPHPEYHVPDFKFDGGTSFFPVEDLQEGYGYGEFHTSRAEIIGSLSSVPEPAAIAGAAVVLLGLAIGLRYFSRCLSLNAGLPGERG